MIPRLSNLDRLSTAIRRSPVTALLGPRQCGKTTLAMAIADGIQSTRFDLESQADRQRLQNPEMALGSAEGLVVLDEIQRMPELFSSLRVLVDRPSCTARFLILGSASPAIVANVSESLAGRVEFIELAGFDLVETGTGSLQQLWLRGGFPRAYLAGSNEDSMAWREGFIQTFLERDIPQLGISIPAAAMRRFWTMLAHYHGQTWNASALSRSMGLSDKTVRSYLDILSGAYMIRQLQPWYQNIAKRQVKAPKVYLRDSGLLHGLLGLSEWHTLMAHPGVGASWEGFAIEQILRLARPAQASFWATHSGAELNLLIFHAGRPYGVEIKFSEAPDVTRSMRIALRDLQLEHLWIVYPGEQAYPVDTDITVVPLAEVSNLPIVR